MFRNVHAPEISKHEQKVRIYCVDVEQVVLHLSDHAAKSRNIRPKNSIGIHLSKSSSLPRCCFDYLHK